MNKIKDMVRQGYDTVSHAYKSDQPEDAEKYISWLAELVPLLSPSASLLELGCGCGVPVAKTLAEDFVVTGIDISPVQIERAQSLVPNARFLCADMSQLDFASNSFAAIIAFYSIIHIPLEEQPRLFDKIKSWLQPGGYLMAIVGHTAWTGTQKDWLVHGAEMFWSHADAATYERWLEEREFSLLWSRFIPDGDGGHTLILTQMK